MTDDEWHAVIDVNLNGVYNTCKFVVPMMREQMSGSIINISSTAGLRGGSRTGGDAAYNTAKGGERLLTKHSAHALAAKRIRVNSIHPGAIATDMLKIYLEMDPGILEASKPYAPLAPHYSDPEDIVYGIIYLASDESKTVTGAELSIDNGMAAF